MAKATPVPGIRAGASLRSNARRVVIGRLADVLEWLPRTKDPEDRQGLHDFRIAVKRLRYALEFLGPAFDNKTKAALKGCQDLQEALGLVTDCDAFLARLGEHARLLRTESERRGFDALRERLEAQRRRRYREVLRRIEELQIQALWSDLLRGLL